MPREAAQTANNPVPEDVKFTVKRFDDEVRQRPSLANTGSVVLASPVSRFVYPASAEMFGVDFQVKPIFAFVGAWASFLDDRGRPSALLFAGLATPKLEGHEVDVNESPLRRPSRFAHENPSIEAGAEASDMVSWTSYPTVSPSAARGRKSAPAPQLAKDIQLLSEMMPPIEFPGAAEPEKGLVASPSAVQRPWDGRAGFAWLLSGRTAAPTVGSLADFNSNASDALLHSDGQHGPEVEQARKPQLWLDLLKAQAANGARTREDGQRESESAGQFKFLRAIKQLIRSQPAIPEERAYALLLEEGVRGPRRLRIADQATLWLPAGYVFLDAEKAAALMSGDEGEVDEGNLGLILPSMGIPTWMAYIDLIDQGYIRDRDAKALEAKEQPPASAATSGVRAHNGSARFTAGEWIAPPKYSAAKHVLSSCVSARDGGLVNCASFTLGRRGAIKILVAGEISNLASFEGEAETLAEKINYDQAARYEGFIPNEDLSADYGLVVLSGGIFGLKNILAVVAAAGAGKAQTVLLFQIRSYWEAILTALIAAALGVRWFLVNRPKNRQEADASRHAVRPPLWKAALWAARSGLRRLFETKAAPTRVVEARADTLEKETNAPRTAARLGRSLATWRKSLPWNFRLLKSLASGPIEAQSEAELLPRDGEIDEGEGKEAGMVAPQTPTPLSALRLSRRQQEVVITHAQASSVSEPSATPERLAAAVATNAGSLNVLASVMRKKAEGVTPRNDSSEPSLGASVSAESKAASNPKAEEHVSTETRTAVFDLFDLVEPGDAEAVSMAVSAHEALQKAHG